MNKIFTLLTLAAASTSALAVPVLNPSNGHYYELITTPALSWSSADIAASGMSHLGMPGHLVTLTSAAENYWLTTTLGSMGSYPWIGLYQLPGSSEPSGGWTWVTGEAFSFSNWGPGEPNNLGAEHVAHLWTGITAGAGQNWNDLSGAGARTYIVEYEPVAGVPEGGTTLAFLGLGFLGVAGLRRSGRR